MDLKIFTDNIEPEALEQVHTLMRQEAFKNSKVRIMPDVHLGIGCVVGFTGDLGDKVIPNVVGVDIGCGMLTVEIEDYNIDLALIDYVIHKHVPAGFNIHRRPVEMPFDLKKIKVYNRLKNIRRIESSIGTLGGGNHFIEIGKSDDGRVFLVVHTGSRNLGKQVADIYQRLAISKMKKGSVQERQRVIEQLIKDNEQEKIPEALKMLDARGGIPKSLAYLEKEDRNNYLHDMRLCQIYASANRHKIADTIIKHAQLKEIERFETIHNYIGDDNIVRKGAISAKKGEKVLIPINMRDGSLFGIGLGNPDWNYSGPHGAGRIMSRREAKRSLLVEDLKKDMKGIYTTTANISTIDESPRAYKSMAEIIDNIKDTIKVLFVIKPIYNFKSGDQD